MARIVMAALGLLCVLSLAAAGDPPTAANPSDRPRVPLGLARRLPHVQKANGPGPGVPAPRPAVPPARIALPPAFALGGLAVPVDASDDWVDPMQVNIGAMNMIGWQFQGALGNACGQANVAVDWAGMPWAILDQRGIGPNTPVRIVTPGPLPLGKVLHLVMRGAATDGTGMDLTPEGHVLFWPALPPERGAPDAPLLDLSGDVADLHAWYAAQAADPAQAQSSGQIAQRLASLIDEVADATLTPVPARERQRDGPPQPRFLYRVQPADEYTVRRTNDLLFAVSQIGHDGALRVDDCYTWQGALAVNALGRKPAVNFTQAALDPVLKTLRPPESAAIHVDWRRLAPVGVKIDSPITLTADDLTTWDLLSRVLAQVAPPHQLDWTVDYDGLIIVTDQDGLHRYDSNAFVYNVRDLTAPPAPPAANLIQAITRDVRPALWHTHRAGIIAEFAGYLVVSGPPTLQLEVEDYLRQMREEAR